MTMLTRAAILAAEDLKSEIVDVAEWGGSVKVRMLTGAERDAIGAELIGADGKPDMRTYRLRMVAACMVGDEGAPLFGQDEIADLGRKSAAALQRVYEVAERLNTINPQAIESAEGN